MEERKYRRMTFQDRLKLEVLFNIGVPVARIAKELGFNRSGIYCELEKGYYYLQKTISKIT